MYTPGTVEGEGPTPFFFAWVDFSGPQMTSIMYEFYNFIAEQ